MSPQIQRELRPPGRPTSPRRFVGGLLAAFALLGEPTLASARPQGGAADEAAPAEVEARKLHAVHTSKAPTIDGRLDDALWAEAEESHGFIQREPDGGKPATHDTSVRVALDDANLYVALRMVDPDPAAIVSRIHRRDQDSATDWVGVAVDGYLDRRTARLFMVNAGGVQRDGLIFNDTNEDMAWDAVWESAVHIDEGGWSAEFRIPLTVLRFSQGSGAWGLQAFRSIARLREVSFWAPVGQTEARFVSRFGLLDGVERADPPLSLTVTPYGSLTEQVDVDPDAQLQTDLALRAGADLRYGITPQITLDATVFPDFGQVEVDAAQINLTAFEAFFPEKRPFFLEGSDIFQLQGSDNMSFFYSRRIGARQSDILGAAKVSGRTTGGLGVGIIEGTTGEVWDQFVDEDGEEVDVLVQPASNYAVARMRQDVGAYSYIGGIVTAVNRADGPVAGGSADIVAPGLGADAYSGAFDFALTDSSARYSVAGVTGGSVRMVEEGGESFSQVGTVGRLRLGKDSGEHVVAAVEYGYASPELNLNDMGYLTQPNQHSGWGWVQWRKLDGLGPFRQVRVNGNVWGGGLMTTAARTTTGGEPGINLLTQNFAEIGLGGGYSIGGYDAYEARAGFDRLFYRVPEWWLWSYLASDSRRDTVASLNLVYGYDNFGGEAWSARPAVELRLGNRAELELGAWGRYATAEMGFVENIDDPRTSEVVQDELTIIGRRDTLQAELYHRGMLTFTRNLSLQYYGQLLLIRGTFSEFFTLEPDGLLADPDFAYLPSDGYLSWLNYEYFQANIRLRWEYRPGSELFLVWTQNRFAGGDPDAALAQTLATPFNQGSANAVVLKATYRWGAEDPWPNAWISQRIRGRQVERAQADDGAANGG